MNIRKFIFDEIGFIVGFVSLILGIVGYLVCSVDYKTSLILLIVILDSVLFIAFSLTSYTSKYAPLLILIGSFIAFALTVSLSIDHFSTVFYAGITAEAFAKLDGDLIASLILYIISFIAANVAFYLKKDSLIKSVKTLINGEEKEGA